MELLQSGKDADALLDRSTLVEDTLNRGFPLLKFPAALEESFVRHCQERRFLTILASGLASILLFGGLLAVDAMMMPDIIPLGFALRIGVYAPVTLAGLFLLHRLRIAALTEWTVATGGMLACLLSVILYTTSTSPWALPAVVELNILVVFVCSIARFWPAVALSLVAAMGHTFVVLTLPDSTGVLVTNSSLLIGVTICFTLCGNYKLEHDERLAFLLGIREEALDRERLAARDRLAAIATTDALTGLANRRHFDAHLESCLHEALANGRPMSLAILDVDHFKLYNDHYGHQAGDRCLVAVAQALKGCTRRPGDLVARWGGEEFAVVMLGADAHSAAAACERLKQAVRELRLAHAKSSTADVVSVSIGLATISANASCDVSSLIQCADAALYQAKAAGRDRVVQRALGREVQAHE